MNAIDNLSKNKQLLFGLCLTERILHFYKDFDEAWYESFYPSLKRILDGLYSTLVAKYKTEVQYHTKEVSKRIPDSEEYEGVEALLAQNAGIALLNCLKFYKTKESKLILECISKIAETLDVIEIVINNKTDIESEHAIKEENELQNKLIDEIFNFTEELSNDDILNVRKFAEKNRILIA